LKPQILELGLHDKIMRKGGDEHMEEKISNIIPTLMEEIASDRENESEKLLRYYLRCNRQERAVVNNIFLYVCGWTFPTILTDPSIKS
jgi:hypothetical protein